MSDNQSRMTTPILLAGLLGGLLGGVVSFTLSRTIKPVPVRPEPTLNSQESELLAEGKQFAESYLSKLKGQNIEEFAQAVKAKWLLPENEFATFTKQFAGVREFCHREYGPSTGEFDLIASTIYGHSGLRLVYVERYERGPLALQLILYRGKGDWWIDTLVWNTKLGGAMANGWLQ